METPVETPLSRAAAGDAANGGDRVAAALQAQGVSFLFTLCGGHISPILVAAKARGIRVVDVRDEATAVFAADAIARLTGRPGVAAVTAGPGVTNALTALENARLAQSPLLLIGGAAPTALQGRGALQDIDQGPVVAPFVKWAMRVRRVRDLAPAIVEAFALASEGVPGPAFVECPVDLLYDEATIRSWYSDAAGKGASLADRLRRLYLDRHAARLFAGAEATPPLTPRPPTPPVAPQAKVEVAAARLAKAERPLIVVGSQALAGGDDPTRLAAALTRLGAPVYLSGMARGLLGRDHALQMRHQRRQALREADCVVLAGVPCDFRLDYGRHIRRGASLIAANRSASEARLNRQPEVAAIGDAGDFLIRLAARIERLDERRSPWLATLRARDEARQAEIDARAAATGDYVNPLALLAAIDHAASDNAIFVADGGDFVGAASYVLRPRAPRGWLDPGVFGTLGVGAGFALAAALARPDAEVWAIFGDGACGWSLAEFETFVRHGIPVIAVVGNDAGWTQIAREQVKMLGDDVAVTLSRAAYHEVAAAFGAEGVRVKQESEIAPALARAKAAARAGRPALVNVWLERSDFRDGSISM
jgi:thiamine pyrophosphate-dependent acetolactate synthase large subunit-like protein